MNSFSNTMQPRRYQVLFIVLALCGIYAPALNAGFCSLDDLLLVQRLMDTTFSWSELFRPGNALYYRPLLQLTYRIDQWTWGLDPHFMHLENIALHLTNALLVFAVARRFYRRGASTSYGPMLAALLFGLHPIATESVNWISGRSDLLASTFILSSTLALLHGLETERERWFLPASLLAIAGALAKEVMIFFLPAAAILLWLYPRTDHDSPQQCKRRQALVWFCLPPLLAIGAFLVVRVITQGGSAMGAAALATRMHSSAPELVAEFFKVWGFYVKKLFWPMPLNFAITGASSHYAWLGTAALAGLLYSARHKPWARTPWIMSGVLLVPAYFIALAKVAWTPLAERYAYLPAAFWAIGLVGLWVSASVPARRSARVLSWALMLLLGSYTFSTAWRNHIWQDNLALFADAVRQSPEHVGARNEYGNALLARGRIAEAKAQFEAGLARAEGLVPQLPLNLSRVYLLIQQPAMARELLLAQAEKGEISLLSLPMLKNLALADERLLEGRDIAKEARPLAMELMGVYALLYERTRHPAALYRGGMLALELGDRKTAAQLLRRTLLLSPADAPYREQAETGLKALNETSLPLR